MINDIVLHADVGVLAKAFGIYKVNEDKCMEARELLVWLVEIPIELKATLVAKHGF